MIMFNENLDSLYYFKEESNSNDCYEFPVKEMEGCVRSATNKAFSNSGGIFKKSILINLEPKASMCFSILGIKSLGKQRTLDIECFNEIDCIKFVDSISSLIQNCLLEVE